MKYDLQRVNEFFDESCGPDVPGWAAARYLSEETQLHMYIMLSQFNMSDSSVLELGSGCGDYYMFLRQRFPNVRYTGIDVSEKMMIESHVRHPGVDFRFVDFMDEDFNEEFDFIIAPGTFNIQIMEDQEYYFIDCIKKMNRLARKGWGISALSKSMVEQQWSELCYYDPMKVMTEAFKIQPRMIFDHASGEVEMVMRFYNQIE